MLIWGLPEPRRDTLPVVLAVAGGVWIGTLIVKAIGWCVAAAQGWRP